DSRDGIHLVGNLSPAIAEKGEFGHLEITSETVLLYHFVLYSSRILDYDNRLLTSKNAPQRDRTPSWMRSVHEIGISLRQIGIAGMKQGGVGERRTVYC